MFKKGDLIQRKDNKDIWGIFICYSDDGSTLYYSPKGASFFHQSALVEDMELG